MLQEVSPHTEECNLLSVIVTTFEQPRSLSALLACLGAQSTDVPFEIIICDDGSSSATIQAVSDPLFADMDIRYVWQPNQGHRAARSKNNAIRCARGDILVFLDGDIMVDCDFLKRHVDAHHSSKLIVCNPRKWIIAPSNGRSISESIPDIFSRSRDDISVLFRKMSEKSIDVDRKHQLDMSKTKDAWLSCIGFSLSIDRRPEVVFDETFEGWGCEDRELALRLVKRHGFSVSFRDDINVLHLEACSTGRTPFAILPKTHSQIVAYMKNVIHFRELYPDVDLSIMVQPLVAYRLNPGTQCWELRRDHGPGNNVSEAERLVFIEQWLKTCPACNAR
jgi:glycosyltransferase involved in cell wall biosynthesis